ncbi:efflux RND transporter permease subunit [Allohahella marinimesophila]|uniref:Efflux RND transporter permease subunit n=1 Tax=Allohahella marinimesophila TaxID=1054972 RepID=A0ABP7P4S0_9GAMM
MNLSAPFIRRPIGTSLLAAALVLLGLLAWRQLPVAPLPPVDYPTIIVTASLPGASPESMAGTVAAPMERAFGSISGLSGLWSSSTQGSTQVVLHFSMGKGIEAAARDVQAAINAVRGELPAGMRGNPGYRKIDPAQAPIMAFALSSSTLSTSQLYDTASSLLAQHIGQVPGVGEVSVIGSSLPAIRVQLHAGTLLHMGLTLDEVRTAIMQANPLRPLGVLEDDRFRWQVQTNDPLRTAADFRQLVIRHDSGALVRLGDVARVSESVEDRFRSGFHNGEPAVILLVGRQGGANIVDTIDGIHESLPRLRSLMPPDSDLSVVIDRSPLIRATIVEAQRALAIAVGLVILVIWFFLGTWRSALIPALAIPVSLVGTFVATYFFGFSLNNLSLMALVVACGLVVDDAIVVLENIRRHIDAGYTPMEAARLGSQEVGFTLLAMNLALIIVFISILFVGGIVERLFREFSLTLAAAIVISLVVSLTLTPSLCANWLRRSEHETGVRLQRARKGLLDAWQAGYSRSLDWALRHGRLVLLVFTGVIICNVYLYATIPKITLPEQDTGQVSGNVWGDDGASFQLMQPKIAIYRDYLLDDPAVEEVTGTSGGGGATNASLIVRLKPFDQRKASAREIVDRLRQNAPSVPGARMSLRVDQDIRLSSPFGRSSHDLVLRSDSIAALDEWSRRAAEAMKALPELVDVDSIGEEDNLQVTLNIDRQAARQRGVDVSAVASLLNNSFSQRQVATLYEPLNQYRVVMELAPEQTADPSVLEQLHVLTDDGQQVPLSAFASWSYGRSDDRVEHSGQFLTKRVGYELAPEVSAEEAELAIEQMLDRIMLPTQVHVAPGSGNDASDHLREPWLILWVLVAVYLVLGVLYESLLHPLTILSTLPSAGIGALLALNVWSLQFSLIALLGLFLLIGIVMKNAILMIDFALQRQRLWNEAPAVAIREAARLRFRPILMTNLAGLLGAIPLAIGYGEGAELRQPLGITIMGGLAVSQLLTLYSTPVIYLYFERFRRYCLSWSSAQDTYH